MLHILNILIFFIKIVKSTLKFEPLILGSNDEFFDILYLITAKLVDKELKIYYYFIFPTT